MAEFFKQVRINLDLGKNQIKNLVIDKEDKAPDSPVVGQIYFDTGLKKYGVYLGSVEGWKYFATTTDLEDELKLKQDNLTFEAGSPLSLDSSDSSLLKIALSKSIAESGPAADTKVATEKAVRDLHDGIPAETMTLTNKTLSADNNTITDLTLSNLKSGVLVTDLKTGSQADDTTIASAKAVQAAIAAAQVAAMQYRGAWQITADATSDMSGLESFLPIYKGDVFAITGTGPVEIGGIEYNPGDHLIANVDISDASGLVPANFDMIDSTESEDLVRLNAIQTLTNKTISADNNTISDLETDNFKDGVIQTAVRAASQASDTAIPSELAVRTAINTATPHVDDVTLEAYTAKEGDEFKTLRVKDGGLTVEKFNASDLSLATSEAQADAVLPSQAKVTQDIEAEREAVATLKNKTIDLATSGDGAGNNTLTNAQVGIFAQGVVVDKATGIAAANAASDSKLATEAAVRKAVDTVASDTMTLTNKTFDANGTGNKLSNVEVEDFAEGVVVTSTNEIAPKDNASDKKLVTEKAVATKLDALSASELQIKAVELTFTDGTGDAAGTASAEVILSNAGFKETHVLSSAKVVDESGNEVECLISHNMNSGTLIIKVNGAAPAPVSGKWKAIIVA